MLRPDPIIIVASWALVLAIIVGVIALAVWLQHRDQRARELRTPVLPVTIRGTMIPVADYLLFRAYIPESERDFVKRMLSMDEERTFERSAPGDVRWLQEILETAYVAWVQDGRPA